MSKFGSILIYLAFIVVISVVPWVDFFYGPVNGPLSTEVTAEYGEMLQPLGEVRIALKEVSLFGGSDSAAFTPNSAEMEQVDYGLNEVDDGTASRSFRLVSRPGPNRRAKIEVRTNIDPASLSKADAMRKLRIVIASGLAGIAQARRQEVGAALNKETWAMAQKNNYPAK